MNFPIWMRINVSIHTLDYTAS